MSVRSIYRTVAKKHGVSVAELKREMQNAINRAYQNPNQSESERAKQRSFPFRGEVPTSEEFIYCIAQEVREKQNNKCEENKTIKIFFWV